MAWIKQLSQISQVDVCEVGGKAASLGEMIQAGIPVPPGYVVLANTFDCFLEEADLNRELDEILQSAKRDEIHAVEHASEKIRNLITSAKIPDDISDAILNHFKKLGAQSVAVRSSATAEDSRSAAWAGQLETFLNTPGDQLLDNIEKCWASLFTPRAIFYRFEKGQHKHKISVAVIVQKMIDSECSGVAFSVHPVSENSNQLLIEAGFGLGERIVSGRITPDSYVVEKSSCKILNKNVVTSRHGKESVLRDEQILELAELILKVEQHFNFACDVEWASEAGQFFITQCRPITTLHGNAHELPEVRTNSLKVERTAHELYWEDTEETLLYAELDDYAWKMPEKMFGYKKKSSIYIYHDGKLAAFYHPSDTAAEAKIGYAFYNIPANAHRIIEMKKKIAEKTAAHLAKYAILNPGTLTDSKLHSQLMKTVDLYAEALSVHYLTQPQFFEQFEKEGVSDREIFRQIGDARLQYTRRAWTGAMRESKKILAEYARRRGFSLDEVEYVTYEELRNEKIDTRSISQRSNKFVLISDQHDIKIITGGAVDAYIEIYENYSGINSVKGIIGNMGVAQGSAFVVSNENLDLKKLPQGMEKGMVLVVQNAWPEFEPYYQMASGIVTNEGGITSHGVIVAREHGIPCIVGTRIATHIFKTGDTIEVDANAGTARKLT